MKNTPLVVLLSVGSYVKTSDLVYSQMLKLGDAIDEAGDYTVKSFVFLPIASCIKRYRQVISDLKDIKSRTEHEVNFGFTPIRWSGAFSFFLRELFIKSHVYRLESAIFKDLASDTPVILHCRNYYSAFVALRVKGRQPRSVKVVFDTRGLMPFEVPYISKMGSLLFGPFHRWEHELVKSSDVVLVQAKKSKEYLELVHGKEPNIAFLPISGFPLKRRHKKLDCRFKTAWKKKQFLYVGSLGHWNNMEKLFTAFSMIAARFDEEVEFLVATTEQISFPQERLPFKIKFTSVPYDEVHRLYNDSLALIIAGSAGDDFFSQSNMRLNYFSTKAVEALSLGVPLVVNDNLTELAEFVDSNHCGFKFSHFDKYKNSSTDLCGKIEEKQAWGVVSRNADKLGSQFLAENVHTAYAQLWEKLILDTREAQ
tara:strand:- start:11744 stop:13015 length:1272 start_codon:yes stop_codon:yes gene_type:complete